jgi:hypothetical protein
MAWTGLSWPLWSHGVDEFELDIEILIASITDISRTYVEERLCAWQDFGDSGFADGGFADDTLVKDHELEQEQMLWLYQKNAAAFHALVTRLVNRIFRGFIELQAAAATVAVNPVDVVGWYGWRD